VTSDPAPLPNTCATCAARLQGSYCHACGEKRLAPSDRTVAHFARDVLGSLFNLDGTLWRTLRALVLRPGRLTAEYAAGRRRPYLTPLRLFLLCNLVYFVVQPYTGFTGYNTDLRSQMGRQVYSADAGLADRVASRLGLERLPADELVAHPTFRAYERRFDQASSTLARSLVILLIPMLALTLKVLLPRRLLADHLAFATHFFAWQLLVVMSLWLLLYGWVFAGLVYGLLPMWLARDISESHTLVFVAIYLFLALRRAFGLSRWAAVWRAAVLAMPLTPLLPGVLLVLTFAYRFLLFWITFWTVAP
jgi:hypothetical protein